MHTAVAYAKTKNRLQTLACTSSIGPGATNMVTGAAAGDHQPAAGAAAARRYLRAPQRRAGAPAARVGAEPGYLGQRLLQAGQPLLGPHQPARPAADGAARGDARADQPGRDRRGHAGAAAGCADRGVRLSGRRSSRSASGTMPRNRPDRAALEQAAAVDSRQRSAR